MGAIMSMVSRQRKDIYLYTNFEKFFFGRFPHFGSFYLFTDMREPKVIYNDFKILTWDYI
jgi:hypothetical protein